MFSVLYSLIFRGTEKLPAVGTKVTIQLPTTKIELSSLRNNNASLENQLFH